jgi:hypothetical protein
MSSKQVDPGVRIEHHRLEGRIAELLLQLP